MPKKIIISESVLKKIIDRLLNEETTSTGGYELNSPKATIKSMGGFVMVNGKSTCVVVKKGDNMFAQGISSVSKKSNGSMDISPNVGWVGSAAGYDKINMVQSEVIDLVNKINSGNDFVVYRDGAKITIAARLVPWCKKNFK